jgi:hypothetical protein
MSIQALSCIVRRQEGGLRGSNLKSVAANVLESCFFTFCIPSGHTRITRGDDYAMGVIVSFRRAPPTTTFLRRLGIEHVSFSTEYLPLTAPYSTAGPMNTSRTCSNQHLYSSIKPHSFAGGTNRSGSVACRTGHYSPRLCESVWIGTPNQGRHCTDERF